MRNLAEELNDQALIEEALANFAVLLDDLDFTQELELLGVGRFQFLRRKQMLLELRGLSIALWRLALASSFPRDANLMFGMFLQNYGQTHPGKPGQMVVERAQEYWGMIQPLGDSDFSVVARHLVSFSEHDSDQERTLVLKLALSIRGSYRFIFDRLI